MAPRLPLAAFALLAAAAALAAGAAAEPAQPGARTVDRTMLCAVGKRAGVRKLEVHARSGTRLFGDPSRWKFRAEARLFDPSDRRLTFAWMVAGWPPEDAPGRAAGATSLVVAPQCRVTRVPVPLSPAGLTGGAASPLDDEYHCRVPPRVLVRVRGVFRAPARLRRNRWGQLAASGALREGAVAVRTEAGRPVAYATVAESGRARLFVGPTCEPDLISSDG